MFGGRAEAKGWGPERIAERFMGVPQGVVVGRVRGDEVQALRVRRVPANGPLHVLAGARLPWSSGESLGEPLERLLRWRSDEKVILALATPSLAGGTVSSDRLVAPPKEDPRSRLLYARWEARERVLESAARFFRCTIESVKIVVEETHPPIGGDASPLSTVVAVQDMGAHGVPVPTHARPSDARGDPVPTHASRLGGTRGDPVAAPPPDVPDVQLALLPLFLGPALGNAEECSGLLVLEEEQLTYGVWSNGLPRILRTLPLGGDVLVTCLTRSLRCSPREAERVLTYAECGQLSSAVMRIVSRVLKTLLPLYTGAWAVFGEELGPVKLPQRLVVVGLWPTVFSKLFCRPPFILRLSDAAATPHVLPRPDLVHGEGGSAEFLAFSPAGRLLEHLADLAAPGLFPGTPGNPPVVRQPVRSPVYLAASRNFGPRRSA